MSTIPETAQEDPKLTGIKTMIARLGGSVTRYESLDFPVAHYENQSDMTEVADLSDSLLIGMQAIGDLAAPKKNQVVLKQVVTKEQLAGLTEQELITLIKAQMFGKGKEYALSNLIDNLFDPHRVRYSSPRVERGEDAKRRVFLDIGLIDPKMANTFEAKGFKIKTNDGTMVVDFEVSRLFEFKRLLEELNLEKSSAEIDISAADLALVAGRARERLAGPNPYGDGTTGADDGIVDPGYTEEGLS